MIMIKMIIMIITIIGLLFFLVGYQTGVNVATSHWQGQINQCDEKVADCYGLTKLTDPEFDFNVDLPGS